MFMKNELEALLEAIPVEDPCDLPTLVVVTCVSSELVAVAALWPTVDPESVPPNIKTIEPKPNSKTIATTATVFFKPPPLPENIRKTDSFFPVRMPESWGNNDLSGKLKISVVVVSVDTWLRESVAPAFVLSELTGVQAAVQED